MAVFCSQQRDEIVIRVHPRAEPKNFKALVEEPGEKFLSKVPAPSSKQWRGHEYWCAVGHDLYKAYGRICAYTCHFIPADTGWKTIEHFHSRAKHPEQAYKWNNYRLVCGIMNGRKGTNEDVIDPFEVRGEWFVLKFPETIIMPGPSLSRRGANQLKTPSLASG